ncbi:hypothetical protein L209DRAFT_760192 [Thermothelomyces heterothallicus CBS 203.75]
MRQRDCQYAFVRRLASEFEEVESIAFSGYYPRVPYSGPLYVVGKCHSIPIANLPRRLETART